jgi:hypothetical protein
MSAYLNCQYCSQLSFSQSRFKTRKVPVLSPFHLILSDFSFIWLFLAFLLSHDLFDLSELWWMRHHARMHKIQVCDLKILDQNIFFGGKFKVVLKTDLICYLWADNIPVLKFRYYYAVSIDLDRRLLKHKMFHLFVTFKTKKLTRNFWNIRVSLLGLKNTCPYKVIFWLFLGLSTARHDLFLSRPLSHLQLSQSQSNFTTDGQSVSMSWCRAQLGTFDQRYFFFFFLKVAVLSYMGRPLWREVGSVICQSTVSLQ